MLCRRLPLTSTKVWSPDRPRKDRVFTANDAPAPELEVNADGTRVVIRSRVESLPLLVSSTFDSTSIGARLEVTVRLVERVPVTMIASTSALAAVWANEADAAVSMASALTLPISFFTTWSPG